MSRDQKKGEIVSESAVRFERLLPGPCEKVWRFLTEPKHLPEWYGPWTTGHDSRIEPREGGAVSLMGGHIRGVVTGWRPQKFLGYTWNVMAPDETQSRWPISYLEFTLSDEAGDVKLVLTHRPIPQPMQKRTAVGWHTMLDLIEAGLAGSFPPRTDTFSRNAALYGVNLDDLKGI